MAYGIINSEKFGTGSFIGDMQKSGIINAPIDEQARFTGGRAGCPIVEKLIKERSPEVMLDRYIGINTWYKFINQEILKECNPSLYDEFTKQIDRIEPVPSDGYEQQSVPKNYVEAMAPINAIYGFSLPRMLIIQMEYDGKNQSDMQPRLFAGLQIIEDFAKISKTPMELMARVAEGFVGCGVDEPLILKQILSQGWMDEHGAQTMFKEAEGSIKEFAPILWDYYSHLSDDERTEQGLFVKDN
ncbi:MAG: hypothetical protein WCK26_00135 [Candidatus Saccharibacteria bacterium]